MDIDIFLKQSSVNYSLFSKGSIGSQIHAYSSIASPELHAYHIAIVGVEEDRGGNQNQGSCYAPDTIREELYKLTDYFPKPIQIIDLGNIQKGQTLKDTYFALSEVLSFLLKNNVVPIVLGGTNDLTYALYLAYEKLEQIINIVCIDNSFDFSMESFQDDLDVKNIHNNNYFNFILQHQPNFLFNYTNLGFQKYFVSPDTIHFMSKLNFDMYRLGDINNDNIKETEPIFRYSDIVSIDISAVRYSDAPGNKKAVPNGFYGEELCQLSRYAGLSDKVTCFGVFEYNPTIDNEVNQTAQLISQCIWYFIEGFYYRKTETPNTTSDQFLKYRVVLEDNSNEIIFYKSILSDRWWMEVPYPGSKSKYNRHHLIPCSYADYQKACNDSIPDRWWKTFQKLL